MVICRWFKLGGVEFNAPSGSYSLVLLACIACPVLAPGASAVTPAPNGGYTGNNTAEGTSALFGLTTGVDNTALGFQSLFHKTTGSFNTAEGFSRSSSIPPALKQLPALPRSFPILPAASIRQTV